MKILLIILSVSLFGCATTKTEQQLSITKTITTNKIVIGGGLFVPASAEWSKIVERNIPPTK